MSEIVTAAGVRLIQVNCVAGFVKKAGKTDSVKALAFFQNHLNALR
ncbi:MAG: hypothetical protein LBV70_05940 [Candidatus Adiutrix sp.]|nr:hypothetical protein [Candidatus Adiutrix sp.]